MKNSILALVALFLFFHQKMAGQCLAGHYSVGAAGADFPTIQSAIDTFLQRGLCDTVFLDIRPGVYAERFETKAPTFFITPIVLQPDPNFSGEVRFSLPSSNASSDPNYILRVNGNTFYRFKNLVFERTGAGQFGRLVEASFATFTEFENCRFVGKNYASPTSDSSQTALFSVAENSNFQQLVFKNCTFSGGSWGIFVPKSAIESRNLWVEKCQFSGQPSGGIFLNGMTGIDIRSSFFDIGLDDSAATIHLRDCFAPISIAQNQLKTTGTGLKIDPFSPYPIVAQRVLVAHNFFVAPSGRAAQIVGNSNGLSSNFTFAFNSVRAKNGLEISNLRDGGTKPNESLVVAANIFDIAEGPALRFLTKKELGFGVFQSNCFVPKMGQTAVAEQVESPAKTWSFGEWQTADRAVFSIQKSIAFVGPNDLHLAAMDEDLNGRAVGFPFLANEKKDIDGDDLHPKWPDIGAEQFELPVANAEIAFVGDTLQRQPCGALFSFKIRLKNAGEKPLSSAKISWKLNGQPQPEAIWQGHLEVDSTVEIMLGAVPFFADSSHFAEAAIESIDGKKDIYRADNQSFVRVLTDLSGGDLTVGRGGRFTSMTALNERLQKTGLCASARILLMPGIQNGRLVLDEKLGLGPSKTIEIGPFDGQKDSAIWQYNVQISGDFQFEIKSTAHIWVHDIIFQALAGEAFWVRAENASRLRFERCDFLAPTATLFFAIGQSDTVLVENCRFEAEKAYVNFIQSRHLAVKNCHISKNDTWQSALQFSECEEAQATGNKIIGQVILNNCEHFVFDKNEVLAQATNIGAFLAASCDSIIISNNFMIENVVAPIEMVTISESTNSVFAHNTLSGNTSYGILNLQQTVQPASPKNLKIWNNIIHQTNPNGAAIYFQNEWSRFESNRNCFWGHVVASGGGLTLPDWQNLSGQDLNSVLFEPIFLGQNDLRIVGNAPQIAQKALFLPNISSFDFDGDARPTNGADIGADQFSGLETDVKIVDSNLPDTTCHGLSGVLVKVKNEGPDTVRRVLFRWKINQNAVLLPFEWTGKLAAGQTSDWIKIGDFFEFDFQKNDLEIIANEGRDLDTASNRYAVQNFTNRMGGQYTVGGKDPDFSTIDEALLLLKSVGICRTVRFKIRSGLYKNAKFLPFLGASETEKVIFEAENAAANGVIFSSCENWGMRFVEFRGLLLSHFSMQQASSDWLFDSCTTRNFFGSNAENFTDSNFVFKNCRFETSEIGLGSQTLLPDRNFRFEKCRFGWRDASSSSNFLSGLRLWRIENLVIKNCIFGPEASLKLVGISGDVRLEGNVFGGSPSLFFDNCMGSDSMPQVVANNFFRYKGPIWHGGEVGEQVRVWYSSHISFFHNTFFYEIKDSLNGAPAAVLYSGFSSFGRFENNLVKTRKGVVAFRGGGFQSDFNHFDLENAGITPSDSLQSWQLATANDRFSTLGAVVLRAETDTTGLDFDLRLESSIGAPFTTNVLPQVSFDFDGQPRDLYFTAIGADETDSRPEVVWPGDCDVDKRVTALDWLHLGLAVGQNLSGPTRPDPAIFWSPKFAEDWPDSVQNVNSKHSDGDGDGLILAKDTAAIALNFGDEHFILGLPMDRNGLQLFIDLPSGPFSTGQKIAAPIRLAAAPESIYGLAVELEFSQNAIKTGSFWADFSQNWLGSDAIGFFEKGASDRISLALTKTNGSDAAGFGQIGTLHFEVGPLADSLKIRAVGTRGLLADGSEKAILPAEPSAVDVVLDQKNWTETALEIWPNPTDGRVFLKTEKALAEAEIEVVDALGRRVFFQKMERCSSGVFSVDLTGASAGFYVLKMRVDGHVFGAKRLIINKL